MKSVLLDRPGAVTQDPESTVAWHYGDPLREQKHLALGMGVVDRSDRDVIVISGPERLSWLHTLTSQHLVNLAENSGSELLVLSPNGHLEHHANVFHDGPRQRVFLDTEPGAGAGLHDYLTKMKFFTDVTIEDVSQQWGLISFTGPTELAAPDITPVPGAKFATGDLPQRPTCVYSGESTAAGGFERRTDALAIATVDRLVPLTELASSCQETATRHLVGAWAYETLRIPALRPCQGIDSDHKTIPHEMPQLFSRAVHLDKGCYRGQETVARVHNLGKPPRTLVMLHLDGTVEAPPEPGTDITANDRVVGRIGTAARHYEDGMIALALVRRNVAEKADAQLMVDGSATAVAR